MTYPLTLWRLCASVLWTATILLGVAGALLLLAEPVRAEDSHPSFPDPAAPAVIDSIDVRVVNVEAVVTDRQGVRAFGLPPSDFELVVDGKAVPIEFFTEVRGGQALLENGVSPWEVAPITAGQARGTSYLVFVDDFFSIAQDRDRVLRALGEELAFLGEQDRMAVVAWDGHGVSMLSSWSASTSAISEALEAARARPARGLEREAERRSFDLRPSLVSLRRGVLSRDLDIAERAYAVRLEDQIERLVSGAAATLRSFADPPGRKVMLLLSGGWPFSPGDYVAGDPLAPILGYGLERGEDLYRPLVTTANLLGYTLYPIDAPGIQAITLADVPRDFAGQRRLHDIDGFREDELEYSLRYLAHETGGRPLINGGRALDAVVTDTRSFYWLGFTPERVGDDQEHEVEVRVTKPGYKVRSRAGYTDLSQKQEVAMAVESALLFGSPASRNELDLELGAAQPAGMGKMSVPITLTVPADQVSLLPVNGDSYAAYLEVLIAAIDESGARSEIPNLPFSVRRSGPARAGELLEYTTTLTMRRRPHELVVAVYDPTSGELWSTTTSVAPVR